MASGKAKLAYAVALAVADIVGKSKISTFDTFTFAENLTNLDECQRCLRNLEARVERNWPDIRFVGVWQQQARGAWHVHVVFSRFLDVNVLRPMALECGFGPQLNCRMVAHNTSWSATRVASYLTRYLTRDTENVPKGARVVRYHGDARKATVRFSWSNGLAFLWRRGREIWKEVYGEGYEDRPRFRDIDMVLRLGMEDLNEDERYKLLWNSSAVCAWWKPSERNPDKYPF